MRRSDHSATALRVKAQLRIGTARRVSFHGRMWKVPPAFCGECLAIRQLTSDGRYGVFFAAHQIAAIDLTNKQSVSHLSEHLSPISQG